MTDEEKRQDDEHYRQVLAAFKPIADMAKHPAAPKPREVCNWCKAVLRAGPEPVSHGICCECKAKHFPGTEGPTEHEWEEVSLIHETDSAPTGYNYRTESPIETSWQNDIPREKCLHCGLERDGEARECTCDHTPDEPPEAWEPRGRLDA